MFKRLTLLLKEAAHNRYFVWTQWTITGSSLVLILWLLYMWPKLPPVVPLYYSLPWGEEQLTSPWALGGLIIVTFGIGIINAIVALFIKHIDRFFYYVVLTTSVGLMLLTALTLIKITLLTT